MKTQTLSDEHKSEILRLIRYEPDTGRFFWRVDIGGRGGKAGDEIAGYSRQGYETIGVNRKRHGSHRIAWLIMTGEWPEQIDHIDHNRANNIFTNLRATTNSENMLNKSLSPRNKSGVNGVDWYARDKKWRVQLSINGERKWLGCYESFEKACEVRAAANKEYGFHENHGV